MLPIAGILIVIGMVFGGYVMAGGKIGIILHALPDEFMVIGGAAAGAFMIANSSHISKESLKGVKKVLSGPKWKREDYLMALSLLYRMLKLHKQKGNIGIEQHIEKPHESEIFKAYPRFVHDHFALSLICDTMRMMTLNMDDPIQVEDAIEKQLKKHHQEAMEPALSLQTMADGLPALGIVAAVMGVIKTMSSIDQPPPILGRMIGSALVGTFLGVFLSYGVVGPVAARLRQIIDEEFLFYAMIRDAICTHLRRNAPQISIEVARGNVPSRLQPSFVEFEAVIDTLPKDS